MEHSGGGYPRKYLHKPDLKWVSAHYDRKVAGLEKVTRTIAERRASGKLGLTLYNTGIDTALTAAQFAWALEKPPSVAADYLISGGGWVTEALQYYMALSIGQAEAWLAVSIVAGGKPATSVAKDFTTLRNSADEPLARNFLDALGGLAEGDRRAALSAAEAMDSAGAKTPQDIRDYFDGLSDMIGAAAARNQSCFDQAASIRIGALVRAFGRSIEQRRNSYGLLDIRGAAVAALAFRDGLRVPNDYAYLGAELIENG